MNTDRFASGETSGNAKLFFVDVSIDGEPDQMLVSISDSSVSHGPLTEAI